ncbi:hypothetical protein ACFPA8_14875 [Streptomyces ovatisporus]|uniref:Secreted protein n=1 Tax=Streptomyces ovatisporus TaxID=1128682 RepID=A0ABV9ACP9_9ACTN
MIKVKTTTVALTTVAALLATGGAAAAVATSDSGASPASADASKSEATSAKHAPKKDGAKRLCKRAPKIDKKIDRVLRRLDGDVKKRGSLERLEKRIDNAKKLDHGAVEEFLGERLKDRRALGPRLEDRKKDLAKLRTWCEKQQDEKKTDEEKTDEK